jgi:hypothetical protein
MTPSEVQQLLLDRLGLRVGPETAAYVLRRWDAGSESTPVVATQAKTGVAVRVALEGAAIPAGHYAGSASTDELPRDLGIIPS